MNRISIVIQLLIASLVISTTVSAQRVEFYTLKMPSSYLEGGGKVFAQSLTNNGTIEADYGTYYAKSFVMVLENKTIGLVKDVKLINPWLTTALYQVVYSEAEADFVISGDYIFQASTNNSYEEKFIRETSESLDKKLPISYYTFSASCEASLAGKAVITKKDGTAIGTIPFGDKKSKSESKHITKPNVPSTASFVNDLKGEAIVKTVYVFSPRLEVEKFKFEDVKTKNKDLKKELKELEKQAETLVKVGDINGAGKKYLEISAKEESSDINCNIAVCYEIIGNLTKAKEYYDKSANKDGIIRINKMIAVREKFKGLGLQVVENEF